MLQLSSWKYKKSKNKWSSIVLHINSKIDPYTNKRTHHVYNFGQPYLTLLTSCTIVTYDNYNTTQINEEFINNIL
jgi:hypothetical protein